jgi:ABC-type Zn uptake system ZnuABC Zn-binding protein ZnuA
MVVVLPYLASTGSSSVMMQAVALGRSVVASDLTEIRAVASENDLDVTFFPRGQVSNLVDAIKVQLGSDECRRSQVEHNLAVLRSRGPEVMCKAYLQAFNLALEAHRETGRTAGQIPSPSERA